MATLTDAEVAKVQSIISAFDNAQQINDLPEADLTVQDKFIEVYNKTAGHSEKMSLSDAFDLNNHKYCGRYWNLDNATPVAAGWEGSLEMLRELPELLGLGCYLVQNDHSRKKLDAKDHYKYANGAPAKLDGSEGHYMWGWGRKFYASVTVENRKLHLDVSLTPFSDGREFYTIPVGSISAAGSGVMDRTNSKLVSYVNDDAQYRGGNNTSAWDGTYRSLLGMPATNMNAAAFLTAARKNGAGWIAGSGRHHFVVTLLFNIIFGTFNIQTAYNANKDADGLYQGGLGAGVSGISDWSGYNSYNPVIPTSVGIELGDACGVSTYNAKNADDGVYYAAPVPVFFGLKNAYAHIWKIMSDQWFKLCDDGKQHMMMATNVYDVDAFSYGAEAGHTCLSALFDGSASGTYIGMISFFNLELTPTAVGGTETTNFCDALWTAPSEAARWCARGGHAYHGGRDGLFAVDASYALSSASAHYGSPLCELSEEWSLVAEDA